MAFWEADSGKGAKDPLGQKDHEFLQSREEAVRTGPSGEVVPGRDVELGGNEPCEVARGMSRAQLRFEVESYECVEHIVGQKQEKEKYEHGMWFVFVDVICVPLVHQLIEPVVLDPPPGVSDMDNGLRSRCCLGYVRRPNPL